MLMKAKAVGYHSLMLKSVCKVDCSQLFIINNDINFHTTSDHLDKGELDDMRLSKGTHLHFCVMYILLSAEIMIHLFSWIDLS